MLEDILPACAKVVSTRGDIDDVALFPEEEAAVARAVERRRREFTTVRACARAALAEIGVPPCPIPSGPRGAPQWPAGIVGSITHCDGYRACTVARTSDLMTIGIDAEPNAALPEGVLGDIALPQEREWVARLWHDAPAVSWDRLLFSAKESVYKAWFPLAKRWLGFEDAVVTIDRDREAFSARLLVPGPLVEGRALGDFSGRWLVRDGLILTAIARSAVRKRAS